jgi:hypothetical protein
VKKYYVVKAGDTFVAAFCEQSCAYDARGQVRERTDGDTYVHVDTHVVFECFEEWGGF